jgi:hypothetical protein
VEREKKQLTTFLFIVSTMVRRLHYGVWYPRVGDRPARARRAETCARKFSCPTGEVALSTRPFKSRLRVFERLYTFDTRTGRRGG